MNRRYVMKLGMETSIVTIVQDLPNVYCLVSVVTHVLNVP